MVETDSLVNTLISCILYNIQDRVAKIFSHLNLGWLRSQGRREWSLLCIRAKATTVETQGSDFYPSPGMKHHVCGGYLGRSMKM